MMAKKKVELVEMSVRVFITSEVKIRLPQTFEDGLDSQQEEILRRIGRQAILNGIVNVVVDDVAKVRKLPKE